MTKYNVTGMSCAACSARVEKAVGSLEGVDSVSVSLLTNTMLVEGVATSDNIIKAVSDAGYGASRVFAGKDSSDEIQGKDIIKDMEDSLKDMETPVLKRRFIASIILMIPLMYVSMGHSMWSWPLPELLAGNPMALGLIQLLIAITVMIINKKFFVNGLKGVLHGAPNMDTLVALGSGASFVYSVYGLFAMSHYVVQGDLTRAHGYLHNLYFESAAMILALITLGKLLEAYSKGKTTDAIKSLMKLAPKVATVERDGKEQQIPIEQVRVDDIFIVRPGESIPVDGVVVEGNTAIDESALTGESIPVDKAIDDQVSAATINMTGFIKCRATRVGQDTTLSQIIQMVSDAAASKAPIAKLADKVSAVFVPVVIAIAVVTVIIWLATGVQFGFALARGISVLVISCPCALGLATPVAIMVGNGIGAKHGILFKTAASLEETGRICAVALDKTGTITMGCPQVTDIVTAEGVNEEELLKLALSLEIKSEHPLAKAVVDYCATISEGIGAKIVPLEVEDFEALPGNGLKGSYEGVELAGGNESFISLKVNITEELREKAALLSGKGKTPLYFSCGENLLGIIAVADVIKPDSVEAVGQLKNMGIHVVMLTGDNEVTAKAIGEQVGVDKVIAGMRPQDKDGVIGLLQADGVNKVAMVGDGINDAPALTKANIGMAIGAGTDIAIDAADVVLMKSSLMDVAAAIRLSRQVLKNIKENLFWAFIYNIIGIPVAAGALYHFTGLLLNPMIGAAAMSLSSFCVVTNALRLNLFKVDSDRRDKPLSPRMQYQDIIIEETEDEELGVDEAGTVEEYILDRTEKEKGDERMEKVMKIEGMMCGHCEARVKKVLEALDQVDEAIVSYEKDEAIVMLNSEISNEELAKVVEEQDYKVVSVS